MLFASYAHKTGFGNVLFDNTSKITNKLDLIKLQQDICKQRGFKQEDVIILYWEEF